MRYHYLGFLVLLTWVHHSTMAQEVYELDTLFPVHSLDHVLRVYPDKEGLLSREQILNDTSSAYLKGDELPRNLKVGTVYWGKLTLIARQPLKDWRLHFQDKKIGIPAWGKSNGKGDVYFYVDDKLLFHRKTGVEYDKDARNVQANWVLNQVDLNGIPLNTPVTLVIKVTGNALGHPAYFNLTARNSEQPYYHQIYQFHNSFNIFMFGVAFIIFIYHLLQFFYLKDPVMMWFTIWLGFCMGTFAMTVGLFIGDFTKNRFEVWLLIANGVFYSYWFFGRAFIDSKRKFPKLDKFILGLALLILFEIILVAAYSFVFKPQTFYSGVGIHFNVLQIYTIASLVLSILLVFKKDLFARYFGWGSIIGSTCLLIGTLWAMQIIRPQSKYFVDPFAAGMFLQMVIYSFGMAYRRQTLAKQAEKGRLEAERSKSEMLRIRDLDTMKTRFFTNISHEFRTPLSLIQGPIQQAKRRYSSNGDGAGVALAKSDFEMVLRNTDRLQSLVDELLELSKLEGGQTRLALTFQDILPTIKAIVYSFESMAERENIDMEATFPEGEIKGYFDKAKLEKVIYNLLSNAFKYTSSGGTVKIDTETGEEGFKFTVTDTGKGIPKADIPHVFDRFYRVEGSEEKGSGIGLALTRELVVLHNGTISVESESGKGTIFRMNLPLTLDRLPKTAKVVSDDNKRTVIPDKNNSLKAPQEKLQKQEDTSLPMALIVEDNPDLQSFISNILANSYQLLTAEDGDKGVKLAVEHIPDIILTDVMMPKKDGFELCNILKNDARTSHIPIIMLTAKAGQENKMQGLQQGADAYVTKPFEAEELLVRMQNLLNARKRLWEKLKDTQGILVEDLELTSIDDVFFQKVTAAIDAHLDDDRFSVEILSKSVGFSRSQLHRKLKALLDKTPNQLITEMRLNKANELLKNRACSVSEAAYSVGYGNLSYFTKSFKEKFGIPPSKVASFKK
ncbi:response regulator [Flavobacteriaceae bacterium TP-CH-4]|uniref:histidine kinase n=1 Tax=Pelagihabitans pacificus TaxID=2696054 RepID=A0A967ARX6_9FLAO|nr:ATP-binding protein [Pelagihabitans pacificus]NHF58370.1 response regulator [Pelagihabitans pacificus]